MTRGTRIRGSDPPDIGRLLEHVYAATVEGLVFARAERPEWTELLSSIDALVATLVGAIPDRGTLTAIATRISLAAAHVRALQGAVTDSHVVSRTLALARELRATSDELRPELRALSERAA